ncbi:STAS domain-containing protein [Streptomyces sp. NPDC059957]
MGSDPKADPTTMHSTLSVSTTMGADRIIVTIAGPIDMDTIPRITAATDVLALHDRTLTLDLSAVTFMDSSGLNLLLTLRDRIQAEQGALELHGVPAQPLKVLDITGARDLFTLLTDAARLRSEVRTGRQDLGQA